MQALRVVGCARVCGAHHEPAAHPTTAEQRNLLRRQPDLQQQCWCDVPDYHLSVKWNASYTKNRTTASGNFTVKGSSHDSGKTCSAPSAPVRQQSRIGTAPAGSNGGGRYGGGLRLGASPRRRAEDILRRLSNRRRFQGPYLCGAVLHERFTAGGEIVYLYVAFPSPLTVQTGIQGDHDVHLRLRQGRGRIPPQRLRLVSILIHEY